MARVSREKHAELESFWRFHHDEWARGRLNQREYCEAHGLPLKRFGNWRAQFKGEAKVRNPGLLHRRGGLSHMASHMSDRETGALSPGYIPAVRPVPGARRSFNASDKTRILAEAERPGQSLSVVARRHGIDKRLLFRWKNELSAPEPVGFLDVTVADGSELATNADTGSAPAAPKTAPIIIERQAHGIEVELVGGRRVRFDRDANPETVRAMIAVLEGVAP
jgi:transposase-like protein